jgi:hypothetical protein
VTQLHSHLPWDGPDTASVIRIRKEGSKTWNLGGPAFYCMRDQQFPILMNIGKPVVTKISIRTPAGLPHHKRPQPWENRNQCNRTQAQNGRVRRVYSGTPRKEVRSACR